MGSGGTARTLAFGQSQAPPDRLAEAGSNSWGANAVGACERHGQELRYGAEVVLAVQGASHPKPSGCLDLRPAALNITLCG